MTAVKNNGILKRLGALVMALGLTCALAISASAMSAGEYTPSLHVDASVPHTLDFFDGNAEVTTENVVDEFDEVIGVIDTVTMQLNNPATITVSLPFGDQTVTGKITSAEATEATKEAGYTVELSADGKTLTVTHSHKADEDNFAPVITFNVQNDYGTHNAVDATLTLSAAQ